MVDLHIYQVSYCMMAEDHKGSEDIVSEVLTITYSKSCTDKFDALSRDR